MSGKNDKQSQVKKGSNKKVKATEEEIRAENKSDELSDADNKKLQTAIIHLAKIRTDSNTQIKYSTKIIKEYIILICLVNHAGFRFSKELVDIIRAIDRIDIGYRVKMCPRGHIVFYIPRTIKEFTNDEKDSVKVTEQKDIFKNRTVNPDESHRKILIRTYNNIEDIKDLKSPKKISVKYIIDILSFIIINFPYETTCLRVKLYDPKYQYFTLLIDKFQGEIDLTSIYDKFIDNENISLLYNPNKKSIGFKVHLENMPMTLKRKRNVTNELYNPNIQSNSSCIRRKIEDSLGSNKYIDVKRIVK